MVVPRLTAADSTHGSMVIVASTTQPPRPSQKIPTPAFWSEKQWAQHFGNDTGENPAMTSLWLASLFGTLVLAFVLVQHGFSMRSAVGCLVLGGVLTGFLKAKGRQKSTAESLASGVLYAVVLVVVIPVVAMGILFVGCTVCAR